MLSENLLNVLEYKISNFLQLAEKWQFYSQTEVF